MSNVLDDMFKNASQDLYVHWTAHNKIEEIEQQLVLLKSMIARQPNQLTFSP